MHNAKQYFTRSGFTLIEIIVVLAIVSTLTISGIASFSSFNNRQVIASSAADIKTMLNTAKSRAFSQLKPTQCLSSQQLDGYLVALCATGGGPAQCQATDDWELFARCSGTYYYINHTVAPLRVTITVSGIRSYFFTTVTNGIVGVGSTTISGNGVSQIITVSSGGIIQ